MTLFAKSACGVAALFGVVLLGGCEKPQAPASASRDEVTYVDKNDAAMNAVLAKGHATLPQFIKALKLPFKTSRKSFSIYAKFHEGDQVEYLWLNPVTYNGIEFRGLVNNIPGALKRVHLGDPVSVTPDDVFDWRYVENGILVGGLTTRYFRDQMSDKERKNFDSKVGFKFN